MCFQKGGDFVVLTDNLQCILVCNTRIKNIVGISTNFSRVFQCHDIHLDKNVQFIWLFKKSSMILCPVFTEQKNNQTCAIVVTHEH